MKPIAHSPSAAASPALTRGFMRGGGSGGFGIALDEAANVAQSVAAGSAAPATAAVAAAPLAAAPAGQGARVAMQAFNGKSEAEVRRGIHKSAQDFEATSLGQMLEFMTQTIEVDPVFGGGNGEEMFRQMLNGEYGKMMRKTGSAGIARMVEPQLLRAQGLKPLPPGAAAAQASYQPGA